MDGPYTLSQVDAMPDDELLALVDKAMGAEHTRWSANDFRRAWEQREQRKATAAMLSLTKDMLKLTSAIGTLTMIIAVLTVFMAVAALVQVYLAMTVR